MAVQAAYQAKGITLDPQSWRRPAPLLADVMAELERIDSAGRQLAARLHPYVAGSMKGRCLLTTTSVGSVVDLRWVGESVSPFHPDRGASLPPHGRGYSAGWTIPDVDIRVKTFASEAASRLAYLCGDLGFSGPEVDDHGGGYPVMISLRYHKPSTVVEVSLVLAYGGEEYVATTLAVDQPGMSESKSEIGSDSAHTGFQIRRALDRQAVALRQHLNRLLGQR